MRRWMEAVRMRLIDADALLESLANMCCADNNVKTRRIVDSTLHNLMPQIVEDEPTIEAQPVKHGEWHECWRDRTRYIISVICTVCGDASITHLTKKDMLVDDAPRKIGIHMPYCPKCGAKMDGED